MTKDSQGSKNCLQEKSLQEALERNPTHKQLTDMVETSPWCEGSTSSDGEVYRLRALHTQLGASCEVQLASNTADLETSFNVVPHFQNA